MLTLVRMATQLFYLSRRNVALFPSSFAAVFPAQKATVIAIMISIPIVVTDGAPMMPMLVLIVVPIVIAPFLAAIPIVFAIVVLISR